MIALAIVQRAKRGDESAFAALVDHYYARCLRFALHMVGNREDAEEAVQDTFVRVHGALPRYDERDRFEPWLFRILANRCRTLLGRELRTASVLVFGEPVKEPAAAPEADHFMLRQELELALETLPTAQREAFLLHHVEGMEYEQISAITGAGVSALKMRVKRATDVLRVKFAEVERA